MKQYRLGIDVGTASVGIAAVTLDNKGQPDELIWHHVRIFNEPLENAKGTLISKKAGRREARMQRRQLDRRASRLRHIVHLSSLLGLNRSDFSDKNHEPLPNIRAKAASQRVTLPDLIRIFLKLSKRRGYKGEFKSNKKGEVAEGSKDLTQEMRILATQQGIALKDENDTGVTLGQYLYHRLERGLPARLKLKEQNETSQAKRGAAKSENQIKNLYALRKMIESEFETIWRIQSQYYDILNSKHQDKPVREHFYEALFHQRPLKSAAKMVAKCSLEPTLLRAPRAQMAFQRFRIEKTLSDLRWGVGKKSEKLSPQQKHILRELLDNKDKLKFQEIYDAFENAGCNKPKDKNLNLDHVNREELHGNSTLSALRKLDKYNQKNYPDISANLESTFKELDEKTQVSVINFLADIGSPEQFDNPEWYKSFAKQDGKPRSFSEIFINFINLIKEHSNFDRLTKMEFEGGRASYSVKALNTLTEWLQQPNWPDNLDSKELRIDEEAAIRVCYPQSLSRIVNKQDRLPFPTKTGNAVVDGSLRQIRWTINKLIAELGSPPSEIVVEMAREMNLGISRRNDRAKDNSSQQKARKEAEKEIRTHGQTPTPTKIRRYLLWADQDKSFCPYCQQTIGLADALSGAVTEYEHIIPKSLTQVGLKRTEIVLAHHTCNQEKGDRTPWEAWGNTDSWQYIESAAISFEKKRLYRKSKLLRLKDFEREVLTDESISGFADRQFHQTSWIAKAATQWLECLCPNKVSVSRGELTSLLRRHWKLETVIPEIRLENQLPVLDEDGKVISDTEFAILKKHLEGHPVQLEDRQKNPGFNFNRRPDKRLDHRHHLIDAITLALTSRGLFQQMAKNYKFEAEKMLLSEYETAEQRERRLKHETHLRLHAPEPPMRNIRSAALTAVRACKISIKHDRFPDGAIFEETAYGVALHEEKLRLTKRHSLADMGKNGVIAARKAIATIVSAEVQRIISETFEDRIASGIDAAEALKLSIIHPQYGLPIRKVRCFGGHAEEAQQIVFTSRYGIHHKHLISAGYAYLELEADGSKPPQLVKIRDALKNKYNPIPQEMIRIYKGDVVKDAKDGKYYRVGYFTAEGNIFLIPIFDPRSFDKITETGAGRKKISFAQASKRILLTN